MTDIVRILVTLSIPDGLNPEDARDWVEDKLKRSFGEPLAESGVVQVQVRDDLR